MAALHWEFLFLAIAPLTRNEEDIIVSGLLWEFGFLSYARYEEDIKVSRVESGEWTVCSDSPERVAGAAQNCPRRSGASKRFTMTAFQSFSQGLSGRGRREKKM